MLDHQFAKNAKILSNIAFNATSLTNAQLAILGLYLI